TVAARVAEGRWPVIDGDGGRNHMDELGLIGGGHDDETRQAAEIGYVEGAGLRGAVGSYQAGAVYGETDGQGLDSHVVNDLVVGALQEGRVDGAERLEALDRQAGGEGHGMLFGDADVEGTVGIGLRENVDASAGGHRRGHRNNAVVFACLLHEAF